MSLIANQTPAFVPTVTEPFSRSLSEGVVLYIDTEGAWRVGQVGQQNSQYINVTTSAGSKVNDMTFGATALAAARGANGGYLIYTNNDVNYREFTEIKVSATGQILSSRKLSDFEVWQVENRLNTDLNGTGTIGGVDSLINDSSDNVYADGSGDIFIRKSFAKFDYLTFDGERLNLKDLGDLEIADASYEADGTISVYFYSDDGSVYFQAFDAKGAATGDFLLIADASDVQATAAPSDVRFIASNDGTQRTLNTGGSEGQAEAKTGTDLNRQSDTPLQDGWTKMLKSEAIRAYVEKGTAGGTKLNHAAVVGLINEAIKAVGGNAGDKIGQTVLDDLRAIAARGKALFGAKNVNGDETSYLAYVFDKVVNDSDANAFFTGGATTKRNLGNLSDSSTVEQLGLLRDKWLLGLDTPNPNTGGDTANPKATAGSGTYKSFDAPLFADGLQNTDVNQGQAGTCYLLASVANFAQAYAKDLMAAFVTNDPISGARSFGVRFFDNKGGVHWVTSNDQFVVKNPEDTAANYAKTTGSDVSGKAVPELWVPLLEKAYAQFNELKLNQRDKTDNAFFAIEGGNAELNGYLLNLDAVQYKDDAQGTIMITGYARMRIEKPADGKTALQMYTEALNSGKTLWVGANDTIKDANGNFLIVGSHAHFAYDAEPNNPNNTTVMIYNPWGVPGPGSQHLTPFAFDLTKLVGVTGIDVYVDVKSGG